jgi:hypothetical protein
MITWETLTEMGKNIETDFLDATGHRSVEYVHLNEIATYYGMLRT